MASEGSSSPQVRSDELLEGLSEWEDGGNSLDETPSVLGSSKGNVSKQFWVAQTYFSIVNSEGLQRIKDRY
jgi:hypothetical protein